MPEAATRLTNGLSMGESSGELVEVITEHGLESTTL